MPRPSIESLATVPSSFSTPRLSPPSHLSDAAREIWCGLVAALSPDHLRPSDEALLASYCEWTASARRAAAELAAHGEVVDGRASPWLLVAEKSQRAQVALALRLRLCPSARIDPKTVGRRSESGRPVVDFRRNLDE